jgi:hypothetical protein
VSWPRAIGRSLRDKLLVVSLSTTFVALLTTAAALVFYDVRNYEASWVSDLASQADIVGRASAAALAFDDPEAARENLEALQVRPPIRAAAIYARDGRLFATYRAPDAKPSPFRRSSRSPGTGSRRASSCCGEPSTGRRAAGMGLPAQHLPAARAAHDLPGHRRRRDAGQPAAGAAGRPRGCRTP